MPESGNTKALDPLNTLMQAACVNSNFLDALSGPVYFCDPNGVVMHWNKQAELAWGRTPHSDGQPDYFCAAFKLCRADGTRLLQHETPIAKALASGERVQAARLIIERPDQSRRYVSVNAIPIRGTNSEMVGAVTLMEDITARVTAEQQVAVVQERFWTLLDALPAAAYVCDKDGLIVHYNQGAVEAWGRSPAIKDPVDRYCGSFGLHSVNGQPVDRADCWMAKALKDGVPYKGKEIVVEQPDGTRRTVLAHATPFFDQGGELAGAINILVDITEQKQNQIRIEELLTRELNRSEELRLANQRKSEFLITIAHELRNPLVPVRSGLDLLAIETPSQADTIERMSDHVDHLIRLIDDLMDVSRIAQSKTTLRLARLDLVEVVGQCIDTVKPSLDRRNQNIRLALPARPVWVEGDRDRLTQIIDNILGNASKYTQAGGSIRLTLGMAHGQARLVVEDNGRGISKELLPKIFDLFTQGQQDDRPSAVGGVGVGLALVKQLVLMHGGTVHAESEGEGQGSRLVVRLPLAEETRLPRTDMVALDCDRALRILIADDHAGASEVLKLLLEKLGHPDVKQVYDGDAALEAAKTVKPEVLLLDLDLPVLDGLSVAKALSKEAWRQKCLLVAVTGYGSPEDRAASRAAGFDEHLVKPVSAKQLKMLLHQRQLYSDQ